jgi:ABC-type polysaccharide/polyol phosphate export permease
MSDRSVVNGTTGWIENRPSRGWRSLDLRELWRFRELVWFFALRDVKVRYKQAAFGITWAVLQPLVGALAFTIVFRKLADVPSDGVAYPVFAFVGFVAWTYMSASIATATDSLVMNASLVTKVYFPRIAAPIAAVLPGLIDVAISTAALVALMVFYDVVPGLQVVTAPLWFAGIVVLTLSMGLILATVQVRYRDARHATALALQLWLFISPIAYPAALVTGAWRHLYNLNPVVGLLGGLRWALLGTPWPGAEPVLLAIGMLVLLGTIGVLTFARAERRFADII